MKLLLGLVLLHSLIAVGDVPELIGGTPANPKDFPATVYASMSGAACSATVIGPRTLLIAAHCVSNGGNASFSAGGNKYVSKCTHAPQYDQTAWKLLDDLLKRTPATPTPNLFTENSTADWSLCLVDQAVTGITYETLETREVPLKVGEETLLAGYGCVNKGGGGGNDGILRVGRATVQDLPSGSSNDVVTKGAAALCFGDSGGPFYCTKPGSLTERTVCGVNSRGNISDTSYLSSTFTIMAKGFFQDWKAKNGQKLCGYDQDLTGCRGNIPPGPSKFIVESADVGLAVDMQGDSGYTAEQAKAALQSAIDSLGAK